MRFGGAWYAAVTPAGRYLAGHDVLFADAAMAWAGHVEFVERLAGIAETLAPGEPAKTGPRKPDRSGPGDSLDAQVEALASRLADDARVKAYELLGQRERAVAIMERRIES